MNFSSPWLVPDSADRHESLDRDLDVDVAVVGGGICGVATAYHLAKAGKTVALFDKGRIGSGETGYTTAFLSKEMELALPQLVRRHGEAKAKVLWRGGQDAIDEIARLVKTEKIECELVLTPAIATASDNQGAETLRDEAKLAKKLGFEADYADGRLSLGGEGKFHAIKFVHGLAERAAKKGVKIFEKTTVASIGNGREKLSLTTKDGKKISAKQIVIATHSPDKKLIAHDFGLRPYQTFAIEMRLPSGLIPEGTYWDTMKPFHYWRVDPQADHDRLILGGEDTEEKPDPKKAHAALLSFAKTLAQNNDLTVERAWGGQLYETANGLPFIDEVPEMKNVYAATGFSGNGMTFSMWAALKLAALISSPDSF